MLEPEARQPATRHIQQLEADRLRRGQRDARLQGISAEGDGLERQVRVPRGSDTFHARRGAVPSVL